MSNNSKPGTSKSENTSNVEDSNPPLTWSPVHSNLEENILDITGPIQLKANYLRTQPPVNWQPYLEAGLISENDYSFIAAFQNAKTKDDRDELLDYFQDDAFTIFVTVVKRVCVVEEIQKFLVLIDDMLWEDRSRVNRLDPGKTKPWRAFLDLLSCSDNFVRNISSRIICKLISEDSCKPSNAELKLFLLWLKNELRDDNTYLLSVARCLQRLLKIDKYRVAFFGINGIFRITKLLSIGVKPQAQYQLIFCIWVSSFNSEISENLDNVIPVLIELLEYCPAEIIKLPRIIIATFRNLLEKPREEGVKKHNALVMIQCKLFDFLEAMKDRNSTITDIDFLDDNEAVENILKQYLDDLSTFDEYRLEVISGCLEWSVVHTSKPFWKENAEHLNDNKYELLKILVSLLQTSKETIVLCVAAHDLGEYMNSYPRGKKVVEELGGKDVLLRLLHNEHPVVKYHALKSLQILMLNSSELLIEYITDGKSFDKVKNGNRTKFGL